MIADEFRKRASGATLNGGIFPEDTIEYRASLLEHFRTIHEQIRCEHSPAEAWIVADAILQLPTSGPVIECGVFQGGLTAKLSRVCRDTGRELYVCDTFEGLPATPSVESDYEFFPERDDVFQKYGPTVRFLPGEYCGQLSQVVEHLRQFGALQVCRFVVGEFSRTLPGLSIHPALVMIDVDLIESGRDCLKWLWPRLNGNCFFTHEAFNRTYMQGILDRDWWWTELGRTPPDVRGNIHGLHEHASCLAMLLKEPVIAGVHSPAAVGPK